MNNRIKVLRTSLNKSQEEFGKILGLSKSGISEIESGRRNVTEQHIIMLKNHREPDGKIVNENWLRTGKEEMFIPITRESEIATLTMQCLEDEPDSFRNRLVSVLARLSEDDWAVLEKVVKDLVDE